MAQNINPVFVLVPNRGRCRLTTGNLFRDLSTTTGAMLLLTSNATNGSLCFTVTFTHVAANSTQASIACVGRIYLCDDAAGTNPRLIKEIALPAVTPSATAIGQQQVVTWSPSDPLKPGECYWASISVTQTSGAYDVVCNAGDF